MTMNRYVLRSAAPGLALALVLSAAAWAEPGGPPVLRLQAGSFDPLARAPRLPSHLRLEHEPDAGYFVVQLDRPISPALLERLREQGVETIHYLPEQSYVVRLGTGQAQRLRALPEVRWVGPMEPGWKLAPDLGTRSFNDPARRQGGLLYATVELFPDDPSLKKRLSLEGEELDAFLEELFDTRTRVETHLRELWVAEDRK